MIGCANAVVVLALSAFLAAPSSAVIPEVMRQFIGAEEGLALKGDNGNYFYNRDIERYHMLSPYGPQRVSFSAFNFILLCT